MKFKQNFNVLNVDPKSYHGHRYNVQVINNGSYTGIGRFFKTKKEVNQYIKKVKKQNKERR